MSFHIAIGPRVRKSPYFDRTVEDGVTHFSIYNRMLLPLYYGAPDAEYRRLIEGVAMWDVAAQRQIEITGPDAERLVRYLTPRDLKDCDIGRGYYVPLCDHHGSLINDPILLAIDKHRFWLSISDSDTLLWVRAVAEEGGFDVAVQEPDVSPLAIQRPYADAVALDLFGDRVEELKYFWFRETDLDGIPLIVARSGWSKQGGFELYLRDADRGAELWDRVKEAGRPHGIGPGGPNFVERVESGLLSFHAETLPDTDPFEVGLDRLMALDRSDEFIGKQALRQKAAEGPKRNLIGIVFDGAPVPANPHLWPVRVDGARVGAVRAACYSPRRDENVGFAMLDTRYAELGTPLEFDGETGQGTFRGEVVPMPLVSPGTPIPPHSHGRMPPT